MEQPGARNMGLGFLWFAGGVIITWVTYTAASGGGTYVITYGAILVGAIQFIIGLVQFLTYQAKGPEGKTHHHMEVSLRALAQTMIAMSVADGRLDDEETNTISQIYQQLTGAALEPKVIHEIAENMQKENFSISDSLNEVQSQIDDSMKSLIVRAAYFVLIADGEVEDQETKLIAEIAGALRISDVQFSRIIEELTKPESLPQETTV